MDEDAANKKKNFNLNLNDDRFVAIYSDSRFALDPTNKLYK